MLRVEHAWPRTPVRRCWTGGPDALRRLRTKSPPSRARRSSISASAEVQACFSRGGRTGGAPGGLFLLVGALTAPASSAPPPSTSPESPARRSSPTTPRPASARRPSSTAFRRIPRVVGPRWDGGHRNRRPAWSPASAASRTPQPACAAPATPTRGHRRRPRRPARRLQHAEPRHHGELLARRSRRPRLLGAPQVLRQDGCGSC